MGCRPAHPGRSSCARGRRRSIGGSRASRRAWGEKRSGSFPRFDRARPGDQRDSDRRAQNSLCPRAVQVSVSRSKLPETADVSRFGQRSMEFEQFVHSYNSYIRVAHQSRDRRRLKPASRLAVGPRVWQRNICLGIDIRSIGRPHYWPAAKPPDSLRVIYMGGCIQWGNGMWPCTGVGNRSVEGVSQTEVVHSRRHRMCRHIPRLSFPWCSNVLA